MNINDIKQLLANLSVDLSKIYGAIDTFKLEGYAQRGTANNCMDTIRELITIISDATKELNNDGSNFNDENVTIIE